VRNESRPMSVGDLTVGFGAGFSLGSDRPVVAANRLGGTRVSITPRLQLLSLKSRFQPFKIENNNKFQPFILHDKNDKFQPF
jgi:hypothetical protein